MTQPIIGSWQHRVSPGVVPVVSSDAECPRPASISLGRILETFYSPESEARRLKLDEEFDDLEDTPLVIDHGGEG